MATLPNGPGTQEIVGSIITSILCAQRNAKGLPCKAHSRLVESVWLKLVFSHDIASDK